jgi:hypothetical protein
VQPVGDVCRERRDDDLVVPTGSQGRGDRLERVLAANEALHPTPSRLLQHRDSELERDGRFLGVGIPERPRHQQGEAACAPRRPPAHQPRAALASRRCDARRSERCAGPSPRSAQPRSWPARLVEVAHRGDGHALVLLRGHPRVKRPTGAPPALEARKASSVGSRADPAGKDVRPEPGSHRDAELGANDRDPRGRPLIRPLDLVPSSSRATPTRGSGGPK